MTTEIKYKGYILASTKAQPHPEVYDEISFDFTSNYALTQSNLRRIVIKKHVPTSYVSFGLLKLERDY